MPFAEVVRVFVGVKIPYRLLDIVSLNLSNAIKYKIFIYISSNNKLKGEFPRKFTSSELPITLMCRAIVGSGYTQYH